MSIESYVNSAINLWAVKNIPFMLRGGYITMNHRMWFNGSKYKVPGFDSWAHHDYHDDCIRFLTAVVMAREWERGTFEVFIRYTS